MTGFRFNAQYFNNPQSARHRTVRASRVRVIEQQALALGLSLGGHGDRLVVRRGGEVLAAGDVEQCAAYINRYRLQRRRYDG